MEKKKHAHPEWTQLFLGAVISLALYLLGHMILAALLIRGILGETNTFWATAALCLVSTAIGGTLTARRCAFGPLAGGLLSAGVFCSMLIAIGALCWNGITWTGQGGGVLLCALAGGLSAALLCGRKRKKKKYRRR